MRHGRKINKLSRTASHRKALLSNMASSLILHKRINTTVAKAKELRKYVEPLITRAKEDTTHSRRMVFSYLQNKESVKTLFNEVADRITDRPGGYTRIIKTGQRFGDNAEMCLMELVDFNELYTRDAEERKVGKTRRSRRGKGGKPVDEAQASETAAESHEKVKAEAKPGETGKAEPKAAPKKEVRSTKESRQSKPEKPKPAKGKKEASDKKSPAKKDKEPKKGKK